MWIPSKFEKIKYENKAKPLEDVDWDDFLCSGIENYGIGTGYFILSDLLYQSKYKNCKFYIKDIDSGQDYVQMTPGILLEDKFSNSARLFASSSLGGPTYTLGGLYINDLTYYTKQNNFRGYYSEMTFEHYGTKYSIVCCFNKNILYWFQYSDYITRLNGTHIQIKIVDMMSGNQFICPTIIYYDYYDD